LLDQNRLKKYLIFSKLSETIFFKKIKKSSKIMNAKAFRSGEKDLLKFFFTRFIKNYAKYKKNLIKRYYLDTYGGNRIVSEIVKTYKNLNNFKHALFL
jgi:hypothetical protein